MSQDSHDGHDHHSHHRTPASFNRAFAIGISLNVALVIGQAVVGYLSHSLALIADAGHNLGDVLGLILAWGASRLATSDTSDRYTYGYKSSSILAALFNSVFLLVATGGIAWEAIRRFNEPASIEGGWVIAMALLGIAINAGSAMLFHSGSKTDLNIKGAFLHLIADALVSLGVAIAGFFILKTGLSWIDPLTSLLVCVVVVWSSWGLFRDALRYALHAVPPGVDLGKVRLYLEGLPNVSKLHDLHVWGMSTTETALTCHLVLREPIKNQDQFLKDLAHELSHEFEIAHTTIRVECASFDDCALSEGHK